MNKKILFTPVVTLLSGCVIVTDISSGNLSWGSWTERQRDLHQEIDRIDYVARGTLYVVQGDATRLRIEGNENAIAKVSVDESGNTLSITEDSGMNAWWQDRNDPAKVSDVVYYLEIPSLTEIRHRGQGEIKVGPMTLDRLTVTSGEHADTNFSSVNARQFQLEARDHANVNIETLDADRAQIRASTHGDVYAHDVNALDLDLRIHDHGEIWLAGRSDVAKIELRDHADLDASRLQCDVVDIDASDHANAALWAENSLRLAKRDHAQVQWTGSPQLSESVSISAK